MHRFVVDFPLTTGEIRLKDRALTHQLRRVLRVLPGQQVVLCDGAGTELTVTLSSYTDEGCLLMSYGAPTKVPARERETVFYISILKNNNFDWAVEKAVEAGVDTIVPLLTARCEKKSINKQRLTKIMKEASEQCGRAYLAKLAPIAKYDKVMREPFERTIIFNPDGQPVTTINWQEAGQTRVFIGPEGGFTPEEIETAKGHGAEIVSLGANILRAETAAAVIGYLACHE